MPDLYITQALPNPTGKDRPPHGGPTNAQLNGEWIEFANTSGRPLNLQGVRLLHDTFGWRCERTGQDAVTTFQGSLDSGLSIRVHTGSGEGQWEGNVFHFYVGRSNYIWNNNCGDRATLAIEGGTIDWARYTPNPPEGRILRRVAGTNNMQ
ncbi:MAG TPA: lamin tail domain-containing protein [Thermoanaerobaculia bacterium]|jgi:hypothetical protein|nr:lamin tail domain-containing protein [Thermoanaerobaculia bacterium]